MQSCRKRGKRLRNVKIPGCVGCILAQAERHADKVRTAENSRHLLISFGELNGTMLWGVIRGVFFPMIFMPKVVSVCKFCPWKSVLLQVHPKASCLPSSQHSLLNKGPLNTPC